MQVHNISITKYLIFLVYKLIVHNLQCELNQYFKCIYHNNINYIQYQLQKCAVEHYKGTRSCLSCVFKFWITGSLIHHHHHHHYHHISLMELGHLLTRSDLTHQKSLHRSTMIPSASWTVVFHYPGLSI